MMPSPHDPVFPGLVNPESVNRESIAVDDDGRSYLRNRVRSIAALYGQLVAAGRIRPSVRTAVDAHLAALAVLVGLALPALLPTVAGPTVTGPTATEATGPTSPVVRNVRDIAALRVARRPLPPKFRRIFGLVPYRATYMLHGPAGGGKSTLALMYADVVARQDAARGRRVLYVNAEQPSVAGGMTARIRRARVGATNIDVLDTKRLEDVTAILAGGAYSFVVIDSISRMHGNHVTHVEGLLRIVEEFPDVSLMFITHEEKSERTYKGGSGLAHDAEIIARVERGCAVTEKSHYAEEEPAPVCFMQWESNAQTPPTANARPVSTRTATTRRS